MINIDKIEKGIYPLVDKVSREIAREGAVLLNNDNTLPFNINNELAVFGRAQLNYHKCGTGSGGMINTIKALNIVEAMLDNNFVLNKELLELYRVWEAENPVDLGNLWNAVNASQIEMPVNEELVGKISSKVDTALIVIGRLAGEGSDLKLGKGAYLLSDEEENLISHVTKHFKKVCVLINGCNIIDLSWTKKYNIGALLYFFPSGQSGCLALCDILSGKCSPSGKLPVTCAKSIYDFPSTKSFGNPDNVVYEDDIYVGYRYFETFAKERVVYPFGFGLSYAKFEISYSATLKENKIQVTANVKNISTYQGKEVIQVYFSAPQGKLGKPARELIGYKKTKLLSPDEQEVITITFDIEDMYSYDDSGITGHKSCYILEEGIYEIFAGTNVRDAQNVFSYTLNSLKVISQLSECMAPTSDFERIKPIFDNDKFVVSYEKVPTRTVDLKQKIEKNIAKEIPYSGDRGIKLVDVYNKKNTLDEFVAQLDFNDLACIIRGEGMNSPKVTAGTGAAFGGVSESLSKKGIPAVCATDGPSGIRLDSGAKATMFPSGCTIASTFNDELITNLFEQVAVELYVNTIDALLGPGINIHRNPLCGRNFEYFSEDPYLTGQMAIAEARGICKYKGTVTLKHLCCNNQETNRLFANSIVSERAIREIYLKGFELAVKSGYPKAIMTSYNPVNSRWNSSSYDLTTTILRDEWNYKGLVMTDWWTYMNNEDGNGGSKQNTKDMAIAQNDVYMVATDAEKNSNNDNTISSLENGTLEISWLQKVAKNILNFVMNSTTFDKFVKGGCLGLTHNVIDLNNLKCAYNLRNFKANDVNKISLKNGFYYCKLVFKVNASPLNQYRYVANINSAIFDTVNGSENEYVTTVKLCKIKALENEDFIIESDGDIEFKEFSLYSSPDDN